MGYNIKYLTSRCSTAPALRAYVGDSYEIHWLKQLTDYTRLKSYGIAVLGGSIEEVEFATLEWVDWFNNRRLLDAIGYVPPAEFEMAYYRQQEESADAA